VRPSADSVLFDLDGTLWDTGETCAVAWNDVLRRHGIPYRRIVADDVRRVTGRPHEAAIRDAFPGLSDDQLAALTVATAEEDNRLIAEQGGVLYPGVERGLRALADRYRLFIVSNCQTGYVETFLAWSGLEPLFTDFECWGNTRQSKGANLRRVVDRNGLRAPTFVGDTPGDQSAALECGVPFLFVDYGFGACPDVALRFSSFAQLTDWLLT
jgi:phosphoglycolate phosphatase